jgi:hypothetical protein
MIYTSRTTRGIGYPLIEGKHFPIWEENWSTWEAFLSINTQWRLDSQGMARSLDNTAVIETLRESGMKKKERKRILPKLTLIANAALVVWVDERKRLLREAKRR